MIVASQSVRRRMMQHSGVFVFAPPSPQRNRGDEALLRSLLQGLNQLGRPVTIVATGKNSLEFLDDFPDFRRIHTSYPAFTSLEASSDLIRLMPQIANAAEVILIGADVVDEGYGVSRSFATLQVMQLCTRIGIPARIVSFSINEIPSQALGKRFVSLAKKTRFFVRDPISIRRLEAAGVTNITPAGDLAFLLEPARVDEIPHNVREFIDASAGPTIGLNFIRKVLGDGEQFNDRMHLISQACSRLAVENGWRFLLLPHDDLEDIRDLREISACFRNDGGSAWSLLVDPVPRAAVAKRIVGMCCHVFTCRLHLGIATLGMERPITGFAYQGKFEGQFELFGLSSERLISESQFPKTADDMVRLMRSRLAQNDQLTKQIQNRLPFVRELSLKNFDGL